MKLKLSAVGIILIFGFIFSSSKAVAQGNVGIGTPLPQAKLHVAGNQIIDSSLR